jgi:hypothetical protein
MATTINASTSAGLVSTADTSGVLQLQAANTTVLNAELGKALALQGATSTTGCGIAFPATQVASTDVNTLDDYEEGTWTTTLVPASGSFSSVTYNDQTGYYTKIGRQVTVTFWMYTSAISVGTASGNLSIGGLPFSVLSTTPGNRGSGAVGNCNGWATTNNPESVSNLGGGTTLTIYKRTTAGGTQSVVQVSDLVTGTTGNGMQVTFTYFTS